MKTVGLLLGLLVGTFSSVRLIVYNISYTMTCTSMNITKCATWSVTGTMQQDTSGCFPGRTMVLTDNGYKTMEELKVGDQIYAYNPKTLRSEFTRVESWLHRDTDSLYEYVHIGNQ